MRWAISFDEFKSSKCPESERDWAEGGEEQYLKHDILPYKFNCFGFHYQNNIDTLNIGENSQRPEFIGIK